MANQIPELFDPVKFARQSENISGQIDLVNLSRLTKSLTEHLDENNAATQNNAKDGVESRVEGNDVVFFELNFSLKGKAYVASGWYKTEVSMICQRCLERIQVPVAEKINLEFVIGEEAKSSLEDSEYDVINLTTETMKLQNLIEDELLLGLPFAPMHEENKCPASHRINDIKSKETQEQDRPNPFAVLAKLKKDQES